jgi:hypothetical protein
LVDDGFESRIDCDGWSAHYGTAAPANGGFESARACLICRQGDVYVDKIVPLPVKGTVVFELMAKRTTAPSGTPVYLHAIFANDAGENAATERSLGDGWTSVRLIYATMGESTSLKLRIRVEAGCVLVDDVRAWLER